VAFTTAIFNHRKTRIAIPWFIAFFVLAAVVRSYSPLSTLPIFNGLLVSAKIGLAITLFLIGSALSREAVKNVGVRPLAQGIVLWATVAVTSMWLVRSGLIG
jgi:uncharacterized membrane protein YadS